MLNLKLLRVIRPHIVAGGFLGYLVGVLFSLNMGGSISIPALVLGYLIVLFMDLSTHFNNDYFDIEIDKSAPFKPFGNTNQFIENPELMKTALYVSGLCSLTSLACVTLLVMIGVNRVLFFPVILFNLLGWMYSAPPVRLHSRRLGEITIAVGTGFCIPAVGYIITQGGLDHEFTIFSVPLMLYGFILSLCLQIPDYEVDKAMNKNTLVGLTGRKSVYFLVLLSSILASGVYHTIFSSGPNLLSYVPWISTIPLVSSLITSVKLSGSQEQAKLFTKINITALFIFITGLNLLLVLGLVTIIS